LYKYIFAGTCENETRLNRSAHRPSGASWRMPKRIETDLGEENFARLMESGNRWRGTEIANFVKEVIGYGRKVKTRNDSRKYYMDMDIETL